MSQSHAEAKLETSQNQEGTGEGSSNVIDSLVADLGKAATLAEWIYAGLRFEKRDWSAELRKSAEVSLPELAVFAGENTGSIARGESENPQEMAVQSGSAGLSMKTESALDAMVSGVREAKVMGLFEGPKGVSVLSTSTVSLPYEPMSQVVPTQIALSSSLDVQTPVVVPVEVVVAPVVVAPIEPVVETPVIEIPVVVPVVVDIPVEVVTQPAAVAPVEPVVVASVAPVVETPVVEAPVVVPVVVEPPVEVVAEPIVVAPVIEIPVVVPVVVETPVEVVTEPVVVAPVEPVVEAPVVVPVVVEPPVEVVAEPVVVAPIEPVVETPVVEMPTETAGDVFGFGLGSGRVYVTDFEIGIDRIAIRADLFSSYEELVSRTAIYQDGTSAVFELHNGADIIIMPHFSINNLSSDMFTFEEPAQTDKGMSARDMQFGTQGDDTLTFGAGDQMIDPGAGFDVVTGGEGQDVFVFGAASDHDFIVDFRFNEDLIQIDESLAANFDGLLAHASIYQEGRSTQIEFSNGSLLTLYGVEAKQVSADWFAFG